MRGSRGFTLLEVVVAVAVLAVGVTALERLLARSVATLGADADRSRARKPRRPRASNDSSASTLISMTSAASMLPSPW